jgi:cytochrome c-type biogenesis protein CcmH
MTLLILQLWCDPDKSYHPKSNALDHSCEKCCLIGVQVAKSSRSTLLILGVAVSIAVVSITMAALRMRSDVPAQPSQAQKPVSPDQVIAQLEQAIAKHPDDVESWQRLGWSNFELGRYDEAARAYRKATALAPEKAVLWSSLGEALVMASKNDPMPPEAARAFDTAVSKDKQDPRARYFNAVRKDLAGEHRAALDDWLALLRDTPPGAPWEADLKRTIEQVGKINVIAVASDITKSDEARAKPASSSDSVATAAIPGPTRSDMRAAAALPAGQQQMMVQSMVDGLETKLAANGANPDGWIMLMRSRMTLGETAKAASALRRAVAANPDQAARIKSEAQLLGVPGA